MRFTIIKIILLLIFAFSEKAYSKKFDLEALKEACSSIGFKIKTEKHGECVLELHKRSDKLKLYKVVTKEQSSESQKTKTNKQSSNEYSSYFEAKNECTKKGMDVSSNYNNWVCYNLDTLSKKEVDKKHCSELYGCAPEKYDQEIEADARQSEQLKKLCSNYWTSKSDRKRYCDSQLTSNKNYDTQSNLYGQNFSSNTVTNNSYSGDGLGNFIGELLKIGIVIGGAYLLGTALTPATPPPVGTTTNVFTTIIQEGPKYGSPLGY